MATRVTTVALEVLNSGVNSASKARVTTVALETLSSTTLVQPPSPPPQIIIVQ